MTDNIFRLKPFTIRHGEAAQKVGTDALLLGAWPFATLPSSPLRLLDVGTGTGIIALMLAERFPSAQIEAWEVETAACRNAATNIEASPYASCLTLREVNYLDAVKAFASSQHTGFDLIISNPPYHTEGILPEDHRLSLARHVAEGLSPTVLLRTATSLLAPAGALALITPSTSLDQLRREAVEAGWRLAELVTVFSKPHQPVRVLTLWRRLSSSSGYIPTKTSTLILQDADSTPSTAYQTWVKDFLL